MRFFIPRRGSTSQAISAPGGGMCVVVMHPPKFEGSIDLSKAKVTFKVKKESAEEDRIRRERD